MAQNIKEYLDGLSDIEPITKLLAGSFGIACNANDMFAYASADMVIIDPEDLSWVLPIFEKYSWQGLQACMSHIAGMEVIEPLRTESYKKALGEIKSLNPEVISEY